ncbi:hypothetical protein HUT06_00325 [Actinomadura sp. NAK00032]|uniref:hypothetical protein n=1 Tax=Actinomadura sp. NAK00032 TaxID=2742128 RepID=UPI00159011AF|nr:hypothetical protein [Actinomadura sp. NAK00032]QKW32672.1 hypothetical protein HUT06_00325 [Actinomadura sp. NAK00032]
MVTEQVDGPKTVVASYTPAENPPGWRRVAGEVRLAVATALPFTRYSAGELMGVLSQLALFADAEGQPIRADLWLTREYIERFILVGCAHLGEASRANYRSKLLRLREALFGGVCATGAPARLSGSVASCPYTRAEQVSLWTWACGQPTDELRDGLAALISLGLGCGLGSSEIIPLRAGDVSACGTADGGHDQPTVVAVRGRRSRLVVCRRPWESILAGLATRGDTADCFLFRPRAVRRGGNLVTNFVSRAQPSAGTPALRTSRLRATWLASLVEAGLPLKVIVAAAGLETLHGLSRLMPHIGAVEISEAARLLRDVP